MAKIVIIKSSESRMRYRFVSEPLRKSGHDVEVADTGNIAALLWRVFRFTSNTKRPDLVIAVGMGIKVVVVAWMLKFFEIRMVYRLGGSPVFDRAEVAISAWSQGRYRTWLKAVMNRLAAKSLLKRATEVLVVNQGIKDSLNPYLNRAGQIWVVPQFCRGAVCPRNYDVADPPVLLTAANLKYRKKAEGVVWVIKQLASYVRKTGTVVLFRIAGGGAHHRDVKEYLEHEMLPSELKVELLGYVPEMDVLFREADVFVYHSEHDATPNVLLESKRWALPVLLNEYKPFLSIVSDDSSGLFYRDAITFHEQLDRLLKNKALRQRLGEEAAWEHENTFSIDAIAEKLEKALFRL